MSLIYVGDILDFIRIFDGKTINSYRENYDMAYNGKIYHVFSKPVNTISMHICQENEINVIKFIQYMKYDLYTVIVSYYDNEKICMWLLMKI